MLRDIAFFFIGYAAGLAALVFVLVTVLCLGDGKFEQGCGGFGLYFAMWLVFYMPVAIVGACATWLRTARISPSRRRNMAAVVLLATLGGAAASFLLDAKWQHLLVEYCVAALLFYLFRRVAYGHHLNSNEGYPDGTVREA